MGALPARIVRTYTTWHTGKLPRVNPATVEENITTDGEQKSDLLKSGQHFGLAVNPVGRRLSLSEYMATQQQFGGPRLYLIGVIKYWDEPISDDSVLRRTFFCRLYDPEVKRFDKVEDPDYEYEE